MSEKITVAIDASFINGAVGGVQNVVETLAEGLNLYRSEEFEYYWIVLYHTSWWKHIIPSNHKVIKIHFIKSALAHILIKLSPKFTRELYTKLQVDFKIQNYEKIEKKLINKKVKIIHTILQNGITSEKIPYIYHPHDLQHKYIPTNFSPNQIKIRENNWQVKAKQAKIVVAETIYVKEDLIKFWKIKKDKIALMVTPTNFQQNFEVYEAEDYAVYPSAFWRHKNHKKLIEAIKLLKEDNVKFMFYFSGEIGMEGREVIKYVRKLKVEDLVRFTNYIKRPQLEELILKCKFVVIPSIYESLSLPGFEAIRANRPIVCSDIPQFRYQFGKNATFFDPNNSYDIYLKIKSAIKDARNQNKALVNSNLKEFNSLNFGKASCYLYKKCLDISPTQDEQSAWKNLNEIIYFKTK